MEALTSCEGDARPVTEPGSVTVSVDVDKVVLVALDETELMEKVAELLTLEETDTETVFDGDKEGRADSDEDREGRAEWDSASDCEEDTDSAALSDSLGDDDELDD